MDMESRQHNFKLLGNWLTFYRFNLRFFEDVKKIKILLH